MEVSPGRPPDLRAVRGFHLHISKKRGLSERQADVESPRRHPGPCLTFHGQNQKRRREAKRPPVGAGPIPAGALFTTLLRAELLPERGPELRRVSLPAEQSDAPLRCIFQGPGQLVLMALRSSQLWSTARGVSWLCQIFANATAATSTGRRLSEGL